MTSWLSRRGGGVPAAMLPLAAHLRVRDVAVSVLGLRDGPSLAGTTDASTVGPLSLGFAPALPRHLREIAADLAHLHGLWMYPSRAVLDWSAKFHRPRLISPHGMLDPWALANSAWKKRIAAVLYERQNLAGAACIHALNLAEAKAIRAFRLTNPIAVVPNGVDLPSPADRPAIAGQKTLLFLGRIHPKKGIAELLQAWAIVAKEPVAAEWQLVVAGWEDGGQLAALQRQAEELGISDRLAFPGPLFDEQKARALASATAFILPSFSEGLPMAVLEAWSYGLPVMMTRECNIPEGFAAGAAIEITTEPAELAQRLRDLMTMPQGQRRAMGAAGRRLAEDRFTWDRVAAEMHEVYTWVLGGGPPPSCVMTD